MELPETWRVHSEWVGTDNGQPKQVVELASQCYGRIVIGVGDTRAEALAKAIREAQQESTDENRRRVLKASYDECAAKLAESLDLLAGVHEDVTELTEELMGLSRALVEFDDGN